MPTIQEIYDKKSRLILGRPLREPLTESDPSIPEQLNEYLMNVSREIYCEGQPFEFDSSTKRIGDISFIDFKDGSVVDEDGNVMFSCFNEYLLSNIEPTLRFLESFV
jgi:hypothetical protein